MAYNSSTKDKDIHLGKHDVFINFRGADTRNNFVSFLHRELAIRNGIETYIDNRLDGGQEIEPALLKKIEESVISIVIFSKNYAHSTFCLRELSKILKCKETKDQIVIPVFYQVDPAHVQEVSGSFAEGLAKLEGEHKEELKDWRHALTEIANLKGWDSNVIMPDTELVDKIVDDVQRKISTRQQTISGDLKNSVGIESRTNEVESLLCLESSDWKVLGIWGKAGVGKTKIAQAVYAKISHQFESRSFRNIREEPKKQILRDLLDRKDLNKLSASDVKRMLKRKRVLVVLDDVSRPQELKEASNECESLGQGSRIIMISRDKQVLRDNGCHEIYEVPELSFVEAFQLFTLHAFKGKQCPYTFRKLSKRAVNYSGGNPLVLKTLGSILYNKRKKEWETEIAKLDRSDLDPQFRKVLMRSYDELHWKQKRIFLDIGCFFGSICERDVVQYPLDHCGFDAKSGIDRLLDLGLLNISEDHEDIWMDSSQEQLAEDIVLQENFDDPRKRSRLWIAEDINHVLTHHEGAETVQTISLNLEEIDDINLSPAVFRGMCNLRLLEFYFPFIDPCSESKLFFPEGLTFLPNKLRVLRWDCYPLISLPWNFCPKHLVELQMNKSEIIQLWKKVMPLPNLKSLAMTWAEKLITIHPVLHDAPELVFLDLTGCAQITTVDLSNVPRLEELVLTQCENLVEVPSSIGNCIELTKLDLSFTSIESIPASIKQLYLVELLLFKCKRLRFLPELPSSLQEMDASESPNLESIESIFTQVEPGDYEQAVSENFDFSNCSKLDRHSFMNIMDDAQLRLQRMATSLFKQENCYNEKIRFRLCAPGYKVPKWFMYRNRGSSLEIIVQPFQCYGGSPEEEFMGFVFCASVALRDDCFPDITCKCHLVTEYGPCHLRFSYFKGNEDNSFSSEYEHVFVWYDWKSSIDYSDNFFVEASFHFYAEDESSQSKLKVIECGVHLLFVQDDERESLPPSP